MPISFAFGWFFLLVTILPSTYAGNYDFETGSLGLLYLTGGIGNSSGSLVAGIVADRLYARQMKSNNGVFKQESRLTPLYLGVPFLIGGFLIYGWFLESHLHWFTPLVGYLFSKSSSNKTSTQKQFSWHFLATFGSMYTITTGTTYLVESYLQLSASGKKFRFLFQIDIFLNANACPILAQLSQSVTLHGVFCLWYHHSWLCKSVGVWVTDGHSECVGALRDKQSLTYCMHPFSTVAALTLLVMYLACIPCVQVYGERMRAAKPWWQKRSQQ